MGFIVIIPFAALCGYLIFGMQRWLRRGGYGREWWKAFTILSSAGVALGFCFSLFVRYSVANVHLEGFPIPVGIATREKPGEPWKKSDMPPAIQAGAMVTDVLSGVALCLAPIAAAAFFKENKGKLGGPDAPPNSPQ